MPRGGQPIPFPDDYDIARLWKAIDRKKDANACWLFRGAQSNGGHGRFKMGGKLYSPHRLVYVITHGPIPASPEYHGTVVRHSCDTPACCNPAHLSLGRQVDNVRDMDRKGRGRRGSYRHYPDELITHIRTSTASSRELEAQIGVASGYIRKIRRGDARSITRPQPESMT